MTNKIYEEMHWTRAMVDAFWDWQSQTPASYFSYQFGDGIARVFQNRLAEKETVLDYGCGVGYLLPHLCKYARRVYGADTSEDSLAHANEHVARTEVFQGAFPISALRQKKQTFDAIFVVEVIEHLYDAELEIVLEDVLNLLATDGIAIFTTPNDEDRSQNMILCPVTGKLFHRWQHVRSWNRRSLPAYLEARGFDIVEVSETNFQMHLRVPLIGHLKRLIKRILFGSPGTPHLYCVVTHRQKAGR